ncbi:hypothetical protein E4634_19805 [Mangrovimicrobium sediminis]|uniref:Uncharacterized protein n=1 Tax=Mangrovimicrobium sediminis TaxID=2562682 RepID=A0A4Z0LUX7_9GAMM|nr:hypothetical protein [Haliea sp. SAOS-164]TGD71091.1 hypothetical protein E4634_19805 [Haliea sp. SAOS-164]
MTLLDILTALLIAGLPLFLLSLLLVSWALHRGWLTGTSVKELQGSLDALKKSQKDKNNSNKVDPALGKWLRFGGGFYGLVALYTLLVIELVDVFRFLAGLAELVIDLRLGAVVGLAIEFFVNAIMNFVTAIAWPAYWLADSRDAWQLLFFAYAGYWLGIKTAQYAWQRGWVEEAAQRISGLLKREI